MMNQPDQSSVGHSKSCAVKANGSAIVHGGYRNLSKGVRDEARREVEARYAEEWNEAGWIRRWQLRKQMDREIEVIAAMNMPDVSEQTMF